MKRALVIGLVYPVILITGASAGEIPTGSPDQVVTTNQQTRALKQDPWESDRWNYIDPRTGLLTGGFIKKDVWEPKKRWNIYDAEGKPRSIIIKDTWEPEERVNVTDTTTNDYDDGIGAYDDGLGD